MNEYYKPDLAYIHDAGFLDFALKSAPAILRILDRHKAQDGLVVDLGCGSGALTEQIAKAGYRVLGIDISDAMIRIARKRVPGAMFQTGSLFTVKIPECSAVTSVGECLNYLFDATNGTKRLKDLFRRVYGALRPGGVFVFDIAEPGQVRRGTVQRHFIDGNGWTVLVEKEEDPIKKILTRRITCFRQLGKHYGRDDEVHRLRLYHASEVARELRQTGFRVVTSRGYGRHTLPRNHRVIIARKP